MKVGMSKGTEYPGVVAEKVIDFVPFLQVIPNKFAMVSCDDVLEDELTNKRAENNDLLLFNFKDQGDNDRKLALYKFNDCEKLSEDI